MTNQRRFVEQFEYLILLAVCLSVPLYFSFDRRVGFGKTFPQAFKAILLSTATFLVWDLYATLTGHWWFNPDYILGIDVYVLPVEEVLFFFVIPFCCLFTWNALKYASERPGRNQKTELD